MIERAFPPMTSSDIDSLINRSISPHMVASRLVRLVWEAEYQSATRAAHRAALCLRSYESMLRTERHDACVKIDYEPSLRDSLNMVVRRLRGEISQAKAVARALRPLVHHYQS